MNTPLKLNVVPPDLGTTTRWGRSLRTIGRLTAAADLLTLAYRSHRDDNKHRSDEIYHIAERLADLAEGVRAELERQGR